MSGAHTETAKVTEMEEPPEGFGVEEPGPEDYVRALHDELRPALRNGQHPPVALGAMNVPQLTEAFQILHGIQGKYDKLSGICATMKGLVLAEVKHKIDHGKWIPWLAVHYGKTRKTAAEDMRIAAGFCKSNPRVTFGALSQDLAATIKELEQAQIDLRHPLVREIAGWVKERSRYQLLLDFPADGERGGNGGATKKLLDKTPAEIVYEEAQVFWLPLQQKIFELLHSKAKKRLLHLPITAPPQEASLSILRDEAGKLSDLIAEAIEHRQKDAK